MGSNNDDAAHLGSIQRLRQRRNRGSGGFLLESPLARSNAALSLLNKLQHDQKGKRRSAPPEATQRTWRTSRSGSESYKSLSSSPLSKEVASIVAAENNHPESSTSASTSRDGSISQNGGPVSPRARPPSDVGFDSDPAHIVDMAMRLSERRRKQATGRAATPTGSAAQKNISVDPEYITSSRLPSYNFDHALKSSQEQSTRSVTSKSSAAVTPSRIPARSAIPYETAATVLEVSQATQLRVQKAKTYIELAHEHRRLLPHLPPICRPGPKSVHGGEAAESKVYNPLQYARNRKLRLREKSGLLAELDGWYDVDKVRAWVDAAINSHMETKHDPTECVRLPPLSQNENSRDSQNQGDPSSSSNDKRPQRPRRPKSDWVTHPGDILADAFWLEQGLNKTKIQDRDNNTIYPADTHFRYAGWRHQATPAKVPDSILEHSLPSTDSKSVPEDHNSPLPDAPQLPKFRSTHRAGDTAKASRVPRAIKRSLIDDAKDSTRKALEIFDLSSSSSSDSTDEESSLNSGRQRRGRRKTFTKAFKFDLPSGDPFPSHVPSLSKDSGRSTDMVGQNVTSSEEGPQRPSFQQIRSSEHQKPNGSLKLSSSNKDSSRTENLPRRNSIRRVQQSQSSSDNRALSPSSTKSYVLPSITVNLSPATSRSPSPTKKGRKIFGSSREKHTDRSQPGVEHTDFAEGSSKSHSRDPSIDDDRSRTESGDNSRGTSPFNKTRRESSPFDSSNHSQSAYRESAISRTSTKSNGAAPDHHSRIRGIFKGGRIAEIVGNEVSKVGDYIWKRDAPAGRHPTSVSESSMRSHDSSDSDDDHHNNMYKTPPRNARPSITSSNSSRTDPRSSLEGSERKSLYHNPNLPSFISPFQRDREKQSQKNEATTPGTPQRDDNDHISLQVAQQRSRSRSPRFERLAPPRLDTSDSGADRRESYGFGALLDLTKSRSASQAYNDVIGRGSPQLGAGREGLATDGTNQNTDTSADRKKAPDCRPLSKAELTRIQTLLMMSIAKSQGIMCSSRANNNTNIRGRANFTQDLRLSQCAQHVDAAHDLINRIAEHNDAFDSKLKRFSRKTVSNLHGEMQRLEDNIENTLTPRAQVAADQAGELSMKLTTTSTLAIKSLNDTISEAFRLRKRGPFRWLRRLGYGAIEWGVVSLLWIIWAIVTIIRIALGTVRIGTRFVRWMFWVE